MAHEPQRNPAALSGVVKAACMRTKTEMRHQAWSHQPGMYYALPLNPSIAPCLEQPPDRAHDACNLVTPAGHITPGNRTQMIQKVCMSGNSPHKAMEFLL